MIGRRQVKNDPETTENFGGNLTELDLRDFSLRSGDFTSGVTPGQGNLAGAVYDVDTTLLPPGFEAAEHGLRRAGEPATPGDLLA